ncbi:hypothetical protein QUB47_34015 [Microcoleus sp. AT9_B5]
MIETNFGITIADKVGIFADLPDAEYSELLSQTLHNNDNYVCSEDFSFQSPKMPIAQNSIIGDRPHRLARRSILTVEGHFFCKCRTCCQNWIIRNFFDPAQKWSPAPDCCSGGRKT